MTKVVARSDLRISDIVNSGDTIVFGQACGEPLALMRAVAEQRASVGGRFSVMMGLGFAAIFEPEHADCIRFVSLTAAAGRRALAKAGVLELLPTHVSQIGGAIQAGDIACDVAMIQVSRPNADGQVSLGMVSDYVRAAIGKARVVVAEVNANVPWVFGASIIDMSDIDVAIETDDALPQLPSAQPSSLDRRIAEVVQRYIIDGSVIQIGVGGVPAAIMQLIGDRRGLGVHSGVIDDNVADLMEAGVITNEHKEIDRGITIAGALMGTDRIYRFAHQNPAIRMMTSAYTHDPRTIAQLSRFVSLNAAIEVDLTGQVNAEALGNRYVGGVGGHSDYVRAAAMSPGGRSIIAMASTAGPGSSRITGTLSGPVTTSRSDVDIVVTEHGAAELRGKTLPQRARAMIAIADPAHQEDLERHAHTMFKGN